MSTSKFHRMPSPFPEIVYESSTTQPNFSPCSTLPSSYLLHIQMPYPHSAYIYRKDKRGIPGNLPSRKFKFKFKVTYPPPPVKYNAFRYFPLPSSSPSFRLQSEEAMPLVSGSVKKEWREALEGLDRNETRIVVKSTGLR
jgi:hypothetical protein